MTKHYGSQVRAIPMGKNERQAKADAQALADVRTLDAWGAGQLGRRWCCEIADEDGWRVKLFGTSIKAGEHHGATPDAARAKAAAWVRAQNP